MLVDYSGLDPFHWITVHFAQKRWKVLGIIERT